MKEKKRNPTGDDPFVWNSPFVALKDVKLRSAPDVRAAADQADTARVAPKKNQKSRGRVDIIRQTAHHGGGRVRSTSTTASSVSSETTNHALWNNGSSALKTPSSRANAIRSKSVLTSPNTIMKRRTSSS